MKTHLLSILFCVTANLIYGQAKKPTIMVVPSDRYCISNGYFMEFEVLGTKSKLPDYKKALQSDETLRLVISQMGAIMAERDFPLQDLEQTLKKIENESIEVSTITGRDGGMIIENPIDVLKRTAKADIILDLDFSIKEVDLGAHYATFNLKGLDAYTSKIIAAATGSGKPYMTNQVELLIQMAVKDYMDNFNNLLNKHFEDLFEKGREVAVQIKIFDSSGISFYDNYNYSEYDMNDELSYIIEEFFAQTAVSGRFSVADVTENIMKFSQVRIPLFNNRNRAIDARRYIRGLQKILRKSPFNIDSKIYTKGLGEVWLILGEK